MISKEYTGFYIKDDWDKIFDVIAGMNINYVMLDDWIDKLFINFEDKYELVIYDDGQICCERRFMKCDDDLGYYQNCKLLSILYTEIDDHEALELSEKYNNAVDTCFIEIQTSVGFFTLKNYNVHNGYYGGCSPTIDLVGIRNVG